MCWRGLPLGAFIKLPALRVVHNFVRGLLVKKWAHIYGLGDYPASFYRIL